MAQLNFNYIRYIFTGVRKYFYSVFKEKTYQQREIFFCYGAISTIVTFFVEINFFLEIGEESHYNESITKNMEVKVAKYSILLKNAVGLRGELKNEEIKFENSKRDSGGCILNVGEL